MTRVARPDFDPASVPVSNAATVMLVRDAATEPGLDELGIAGPGSPGPGIPGPGIPGPGSEVFMLRRTLQAAFASGMYVFPGGRLDDVDRGEEMEAVCDGLTDAEASALLQIPSGGLAFWVAAIRECFEEAGVLLARSVDTGEVIRFDEPAVTERFNTARAGIYDSSLDLIRLCESEGLRLTTDKIHYMAHWITPVGEMRRFDTRFFLAMAPQAQEPLHDDGETIASLWVRPTAALQRESSGDLMMMPPTMACLKFLADHQTADSALAAAAAIGTPPKIVPKLKRGEPGTRLRIVLPGEPGYDDPVEPHCPAAECSDQTAMVGAVESEQAVVDLANPVINPPYDPPARHFQLGPNGTPTGTLIPGRRPSESFIPVPVSHKGRKAKGPQAALTFEMAGERREVNTLVNDIRQAVDLWRARSYPGATPISRKLMQHWTDTSRENRVLFCQREAAETAIFLAEVAGRHGHPDYRSRIEPHNRIHNDGLPRVALKMATGSGKTVVIAMLIAWQTINKVYTPNDARFAKRFLAVTPGITIRDRLRVLLPSDTGNYYRERDLIPGDLWAALQEAQILIVNYHQFLLRDRKEIQGVASNTRKILKYGKTTDPFVATPDEMVARAMRDFVGRGKGEIVVFNDEAHHCYQDKPLEDNYSTDGNIAIEGIEREDIERNAEPGCGSRVCTLCGASWGSRRCTTCRRRRST